MSLYVALKDKDDNEIYWANLSHNLSAMAKESKVYNVVWRPEENNITVASQLIPFLNTGLLWLELKPDHFKKFNDPNGWGNYEHLVSFLMNYRDACIRYPNSKVVVSR